MPPRPPPLRLSSHLNRLTQPSSKRTITTAASQAASQLLEKYSSKTVIRKQFLDANQLQKLCLTLNRRLPSDAGLNLTQATPRAGTPIPPGYHLVYFTPSELESDLGADGTDQTYNAPAPFTRRMWAGGRIAFGDGELRVGDEVEEHTTLVSAVPKSNKEGKEMVFVEVRKEFVTARGRGLVDTR